MQFQASGWPMITFITEFWEKRDHYKNDSRAHFEKMLVHFLVRIEQLVQVEIN